MRKTWRWQLAADATALTLLACDRPTRGEMLSKLEIDLLAHHVDAELVAASTAHRVRIQPCPKAFGLCRLIGRFGAL